MGSCRDRGCELLPKSWRRLPGLVSELERVLGIESHTGCIAVLLECHVPNKICNYHRLRHESLPGNFSGMDCKPGLHVIQNTVTEQQTGAPL